MIDFEPGNGEYRLVKVHHAMRAYFKFLEDEMLMNKQKEVVNKVFAWGIPVSFGVTVLVVQFYVRRA